MSDTHTLQLDLDSETLEQCQKALESRTALDVKKALRSLKASDYYQNLPLKKIRLLRTFTIEPYLPFFEFQAGLKGFKVELHLGNLNEIESEFASNTDKFDCGFVFWRVQDLVPKLFEEFHCLSSEQRSDLILSLSERMQSLAQFLKDQTKELTFFSLFYDSNTTFLNLLDLHHVQGLKANIMQWNIDMLALSQRFQHWKLFELNQWIQKEGENALDLRMDLYGQIPYSMHKAFSLSEFWTQHLLSLWKPRVKVIAVDLDNTLWGGILGEDGVSKLKIGQEYPGNVYWKLQQRLKQLKATGVLLVILSKNNLSEVEEAFNFLKDMPLKWSDFIAAKIDFNPKWSNLKEIAQSLNLGLDSFAFIDDSSFEREQMRQFLPEVTLLNCHDAPEHMLESLKLSSLDSLNLQAEDVQRHEEYRLNQQRNDTKTSSQSMDDFLKTLELEIEVFLMQDQHLPRAAQMLSKTNQFNLTTQRHGESDLSSWSKCSNTWVFLANVKDKFSDQGITGLLILKRDKQCLSIDSFLLSCRVLGRKVEDVLWNTVVRFSKSLDLQTLESRYLKTEKNAQVSDFFEKMGMNLKSQIDDQKDYELPIHQLQEKNIEGLTIHYPELT